MTYAAVTSSFYVGLCCGMFLMAAVLALPTAWQFRALAASIILSVVLCNLALFALHRAYP